MILAGMTREDGFSQYLKVYFEKELQGVGQVMVCGYIGEGASMSIESHWTPPFLQDNVGDASYTSKLSDIAQATTGSTAKAEWNSIMNWDGIEPPQFTMPVYLKAFRDPVTEVEDAIKYLQMMQAPELNEALPLGRIPEAVIVDIGRRVKLTNMQIQNIEVPLDSPKSVDGHRTELTLQLTLQAKQMLNQSEIPNIYIR
jgi:sRNA-binding carbon storage regulator CsrA